MEGTSFYFEVDFDPLQLELEEALHLSQLVETLREALDRLLVIGTHPLCDDVRSGLCNKCSSRKGAPVLREHGDDSILRGCL